MVLVLAVVEGDEAAKRFERLQTDGVGQFGSVFAFPNGTSLVSEE
jgi:hypothetical protein